MIDLSLLNEMTSGIAKMLEWAIVPTKESAMYAKREVTVFYAANKITVRLAWLDAMSLWCRAEMNLYVLSDSTRLVVRGIVERRIRRERPMMPSDSLPRHRYYDEFLAPLTLMLAINLPDETPGAKHYVAGRLVDSIASECLKIMQV